MSLLQVETISRHYHHYSNPPTNFFPRPCLSPYTLIFPKTKSFLKPLSASVSSNQQLLSLTNCSLNSTNYGSLLDSCTSAISGKSIHAHALKSGFHGHEFVDSKLLRMYARCGCFDDAGKMFDEMPQRNLYSWVAIISVHVNCDLFEDSFEMFVELLCEDVRLDFFVFPVVLKLCGGMQDIGLGKQIHGFVVKTMFVLNVYVGNGLVDMYGKCGYPGDANKFFYSMSGKDIVSWNCLLSACATNGMVYEALENLEKMSSSKDGVPNVISWSAVISGLAQNGFANEAIELLFKMIALRMKPNAQTMAGVIPAFAKLESPRLAKIIHAYVIRCGHISNSVVVNGLLDVYRRCKDMRSAWVLFLRYSVKNVVSFNTMIVGFCEIGDISKAKCLLDDIELHGIEKNLISWNAMLSGYVDNFLFDEALSLFKEMQMAEGIEVDSYTLGSILSACSGKGSLKQGKQIHCQAIIKGLRSNPFVGEALMDMYFKSHDMKAAKQAFEEVLDKDIATWNTLISGYAQCNMISDIPILLSRMKKDGLDPNIYTWNGVISGHVENGHHKAALQLLVEMQIIHKITPLRPNIYTIGIVLPACSRLATIEQGKQAHGYAIRNGYDSDVYIGAALIDMYSKCGSIKDAIRVNSRILKPNLISSNAMLTAYATHGLGEEGISLFYKMLAVGFVPDEVTFLSALSACVHAGKVEIGQNIFDLMNFYNVTPSLKHYTSLVDLLSRYGKTGEAYQLVKQMPMEPDCVTWGALLSGCVTSGHVDLGEVAAEKLLELEPDDTGNFVLLANLYALAGRWRDVVRVRKIITEKQMRKSAGCSWIGHGHGHDVLVFTATDASHERTEDIYLTLESLNMHMKTWEEAPQLLACECTY